MKDYAVRKTDFKRTQTSKRGGYLSSYKGADIKHDEDIIVSVTGSGDPYCFLIEIPSQNAGIHMHARSAMDLHAKLGFALADWIAQVAREFAGDTLA